MYKFRILDCLQIIHITSTLSFIHLPMLRAPPTIQKFHHHAFEKFQIRKLINVPPQLIQAMFVSRKVVSRKPLSKLSCVCLPSGKLVNEKHFPVNEKHFPVKEKFDLVSRKVFFLLAMFVFRKVVFGKPLSKLSCVCLPLEKLVNGKHFPVKGKFDLVFRKVFSWKI